MDRPIAQAYLSPLSSHESARTDSRASVVRTCDCALCSGIRQGFRHRNGTASCVARTPTLPHLYGAGIGTRVGALSNKEVHESRKFVELQPASPRIRTRAASQLPSMTTGSTLTPIPCAQPRPAAHFCNFITRQLVERGYDCLARYAAMSPSVSWLHLVDRTPVSRSSPRPFRRNCLVVSHQPRGVSSCQRIDRSWRVSVGGPFE